MEKPMSLLSIEAILMNLPIEKIWEIRKQNPRLRKIIDGIPSELTKKWCLKLVEINVNNIIKHSKYFPKEIYLTGTVETRWLSVEILVLTDSTIDTVNQSILPVAKTMCKNLKGIQVFSKIHDPAEYIDGVLKIVGFCPVIQSLSIFSLNTTETQLLKTLDSFQFDRSDERNKDLCISVNASAELSPAVVDKFLKLVKLRKNRVILIKAPDAGEEIKLTKETIWRIFTSPETDTNVIADQKIIVEKMQRERVTELMVDLQLQYPHGQIVHNNGRGIAFRIVENQCSKGFSVWFPF